jgi:hypothetical protein
MRKSIAALSVVSVLGLVPAMSSAGASTPISSPASLSGLTASQVIATSIAAARAEGTVTRIFNEKVLSTDVTTITNSTNGAATQSLIINGHKGEIVLDKGVVYIKLDNTLVTAEYRASLPSLANKWISFTKGHTHYSNFIQGLALSAVLASLQPVGTLTLSAPQIVNGVQVVGVSGNAATSSTLAQVSETVFVSTTAPYLPVGEAITATSSGIVGHGTVTLKNWGSPITVTPPRTFTPSWKTKIS